MQCPKCNQEIPDGTAVCPDCGTKIIKTNASSKSHNKASSRSSTVMVSGILSLVCFGLYGFLTPLFGRIGVDLAGIAVFFGIIALVFGAIELNRIKKGISSQESHAYAISGFTLGIISLILILTLGTLFTPALLKIYMRGKVKYVKTELKEIMLGLESYGVDYCGTYPSHEFNEQGIPILPHSLTTPVGYMTELPKDIFSTDRNQSFHFYAGPPDASWNYYCIIASAGPDRKTDVDVTKYNPTDLRWKTFDRIQLQYDPSNGAFSGGDIFRTGPYDDANSNGSRTNSSSFQSRQP